MISSLMSNMIIVLSQRYEILRIKPEGSQKERGGGGRAGEERKDGSQTVPLDSATCSENKSYICMYKMHNSMGGIFRPL